METNINNSFSNNSYGKLLDEKFEKIRSISPAKNCRLTYIDCVDSTNEEVKRQAELGASEGLIVVASSQTQGQGRSGRTFYSPDQSGIYMSILLKPQSQRQLEKITVIAAVAVAKAVNEYDFPACIDERALIKWVNDIYISNRKIAGIIAKAEHYGQPGQYVVLGIGINVFGEADVPEDIREIYGSIIAPGVVGMKDICRNDVRAGLCASVYSLFFEIYNRYDDLSYIEDYRSLSCVIGKDVTYFSGDNEKIAHVEDIDDDGALIVTEEDGKLNRYNDGEIRIRFYLA